MLVETMQSASQINIIAEEWRTLLSSSTSNVPFLTPEYLLAWWSYLGGGEWENGDLQVVITRGEGGNLLGIAPMFRTKTLKGEAVLMFLGSHEISDYLDFIARPEDLERFLQAFFQHLNSESAPIWDRLDLYNILDDSPSLDILKALSRKAGWAYEVSQLQPAPYIKLPESWEEYMMDLKKKHRHELRRKLRKASNHIVPIEWRVVGDEATLDDELTNLFVLMRKDPAKKTFLTAAMTEQLRAITKAAFTHGWLQLATLKVGDDTGAMQLNFDYGNRIWGYNSGVDHNHRELSTGVVLLGHLLERAIEDGYEVFDFMRGNEEYKYRFGAIDRYVMRVTIQKN